MSLAEWMPVWDQAVIVYGHQPIEFRVGSILAAAFLALMMIEGLRANFLPKRKAEAAPAAKRVAAANPTPKPVPVVALPELPVTQAMAPALAATPSRAPRQFAASPRMLPQPNRKRPAASPRPHRSMRPAIRRAEIADTGHAA